MKTLYILRHAKASSSYSEFADIDRPLKDSGIQDAYLLGDALKQAGVNADRIVVSSAARTLHTATIVARTAHMPLDRVIIDNRLYLPSGGITLSIIRQTDDTVNSLMVVGHNPDLSEVCDELLYSFSLDLPTCGFVAITFNTDKWSSISSDNAHKEFTFFPK